MKNSSPLLRLALLLLVTATATAQEGMPDDPVWGRGPARGRPSAANPVFATGDGCALCHSATEMAVAMRGPVGEDISPHGMWKSTMMANAFRDPYWRAQVAREIETHPEQAKEIQSLCIRCHAPMAHHTARIAGFAPQSVRELADQHLARDGVSCTVCHQARPDNLGQPESFSGNLDIRPGRVIFGPFEDPIPGPMRMHSAFTPTHGAHIRDAGLCGSCHTLETRHAPEASPFLEQGPYVEWLNSNFSGEKGRTCQQCHMPEYGPTRIARAPFGGDFNIKARPGYRGHAFFGGNAFMLDLLAEHREELGVEAEAADLRQGALATRKQLAEKTAQAIFENGRLEDGRARFDVRVVNMTGHKLPTGYPSRRLWLMVEVFNGRERVFVSGAVDARGSIIGLENELGLPHVDLIDEPNEVAVWEATALDKDGKPTTLLSAMATYGKDNRLLPAGWRPDGPMADRTKPVGTDDDADFKAGSDVVHYDVPSGGAERLRVVTRLFYQPIPPHWVSGLEKIAADEAVLFRRLYEGSSPTPEIVSLSVDFIDG